MGQARGNNPKIGFITITFSSRLAVKMLDWHLMQLLDYISRRSTAEASVKIDSFGSEVFHLIK